MKGKISSTLFVLTATVCFNVFSATEMDALRERLTQLETDAANAITIGGVIEVEYGFEDFADDKGKDAITLSTAELGIAGTLNEKFDAYLTLLYEQDENDDNIQVDEAVLNGKTNDGRYAFAVGRLYVPFGVYETAAISDPVGLDIGETNDEAVVLSGNISDEFSIAVWLADNADTANNKGISLDYEKDDFAFGIDWIDVLAEANDESGLAIHTQYSWNNATFIAERITQTSGNNAAQSTQIEIDYLIKDWTFAVVHNNITDFSDYDSSIALATEYALSEGAGLAFEYKTQDRDDNTGNDNIVTLRLAYEF